MNKQQLRFIESFKSHIPTYEEKISSNYDLERIIPLDDPPYLFEVDIKPLSTLWLNSNPQFQTLISALMSWNNTAKTYNANPPISLQKEHNKLWINNTIYFQLARILNEIVITTDHQLQIKLLKNVFDWYYKEIGKKPQETPNISASMVNLAASRPNTSATSRLNRGEASFETGGIRSEHPNFDNPKARLKEFGRRLPNYNDFSMSSTTAFSIQKMGVNSLFGGDSRPQTSPFGTGLMNNDGVIGRPRTTAGGVRNEDLIGNVNSSTINIGNLLSKNPRMNLEEQNMALRREIHSSQDQRGHCSNILQPRSTFIKCFLDESPEEKKLEEIWYKQRHKVLAEKKEDQELIGFMKQWACNKGRVEEELVRKGEADRMGSEFNQMKYETKKKVLLNVEDADLVLQEYPQIEHPENEYVKLENGTDVNKLRVMNEPVELKGGEEIYIEKKKEVIELFNIPPEKESDRYQTPDKDKFNQKIGEFDAKGRVFDSIQSNNTATTAFSLEKMNNQSILQSNETLKLKKEEDVKEKKEIDEKIQKVKEKAIKLNKTRPATEHEKKRKFIKYNWSNNDKLIGDICDSPIIKLVKPGKKHKEEGLDGKDIKIVDFYGNRIETAKSSDQMKNLQNFEYQISKQKIKDVRNHYVELFKDTPNHNGETSLKNSLSIYSRPLSQQHSYRKFSSIFRPNLSKEITRQQQVNEIEDIKKRLGHWNISLSTKKLETALLMPLAIFGEKFKIAESGSTLFENPFNKADKKKKPKKPVPK